MTELEHPLCKTGVQKVLKNRFQKREHRNVLQIVKVIIDYQKLYVAFTN